MRAGTLDGSLMVLCGVTYTEFPDLTDPQIRDHACTHRIIGALLRLTDAGLRVKRLKEPSSSAELVLVHDVHVLDHGQVSRSTRQLFL